VISGRDGAKEGPDEQWHYSAGWQTQALLVSALEIKAGRRHG